MESNYRDREFEQYVKENADQYRMFPSENVWKGVHSALHTRRRWYGFGLAFLLLLTGGAVTLVMKSYPVLKKQDFNAPQSALTITPAEQQPQSALPAEIEEILPFDNRKPAAKETGSTASAYIKTIKAINPFAGNEFISPENRPVALNVPVSQPPTVDRNHSIVNTTIHKHADLNPVSPATELPVPANLFGAVKALPGHALPSIAAKNTRPFDDFLIPSIENIGSRYTATPRRISWQFFVTPTISYRQLGENKSFNEVSSSLTYPFASITDLKSAVTHKPDLGLQIGFAGRYPISKTLKLRGGLQFNVNRYDIKAFVNPGEVALINLDGFNNTISTWTYYRSQDGYKSDWLKSFYFSVSVPLGIEMKLFGNKKTSVGVAGTLQPTYIIKDRAYLISSDYKNYAEVPWLVRRMNVSSGFETFVSYTRGKTQWQIGPQVRYQMLSSFQKKYPVKENLFDFGVKIGVTLNQ